MNFAELKRELAGVVLDQSPKIVANFPDYINEAVQQIAEEVKFPELKQVLSIATSTSVYWINLPAGFSGKLSYAGNSDGEFKVLEGGVEELLRLYPTLAETGDIKHIVCEGRLLMYQPIPVTAINITCVGYCTPALLETETDTPSFIPDYLHREAIVNKAASIAYLSIEDGVEGDKVNFKIFSALAEAGLNRVRAYVSRRRAVNQTKSWSA
jgi:hypothetical protein